MFYKNFRKMAIVAVSLLLASTGLDKVHAQISPSYDAYADSVTTSSGVGEGQTTLQNPQNAVGAPDGNSVGIAGANSSITLDMGQGEEGTGKLTLYSSLIQVAVNLKVEFLDSNSNVIKSDQATVAISTSSSSEYNFNFSDYSKAYRFVRISNLATGVFNLDAIEAANYIGMTATTDTDNGGVPDRTENTNGTNPQDASDDVTPTNTNPTPTTTNNTDNNGSGNGAETATTTSANNTNNTAGTCTTQLADETNRANLYMWGALLLLLLLILAIIGMMYYRKKYLEKERKTVVTPTPVM